MTGRNPFFVVYPLFLWRATKRQKTVLATTPAKKKEVPTPKKVPDLRVLRRVGGQKGVRERRVGGARCARHVHTSLISKSRF